MPDMSAFVDGSRREGRKRREEVEKGTDSPMICPPTPVRTPVWKGEGNGKKDEKEEEESEKGGMGGMAKNLRVRIPQWGTREDREVARKKVGTVQGAMNVGDDDEGEDDMTFLTHFSKIGDLGMGTQSDVFKVRDRKGGVWAVKRNKKQFRGKKERAVAIREVEVMQTLQKPQPCPYLLLFVKAWQEDAYFYSQTELCSRGNLRMCMDGMGVGWRRSGRRVREVTREDGRRYPEEYAPEKGGKVRLNDERSDERRLERSDSKSIIPPFYITNNLPLVASLLAPRPALRFAHLRGTT